MHDAVWVFLFSCFSLDIQNITSRRDLQLYSQLQAMELSNDSGSIEWREASVTLLDKKLEKIHTGYGSSIFFSVKTTYKLYRERLFYQMLTWFQTVDKNKVYVIICNCVCVCLSLSIRQFFSQTAASIFDTF